MNDYDNIIKIVEYWQARVKDTESMRIMDYTDFLKSVFLDHVDMAPLPKQNHLPDELFEIE